jgi:serine/threonine-protein kinase
MQQVGKYQLIRKLATGGMAEVFLAKAAGPMGFQKTLVLKRILPHLAEEPAFVEMFLSEAKLAAQLTHPHIVQIFDFGEADGAYFLAMEYIDGPSLRTLVKRASAQELSLPMAACARIVAHACEGLAFAHDFTHPETGEALGLVHRDISPDNILLSRQGAVKVVDFGIAKAAGQSHKTRSGVIKGKLAYMPPEQVRAEPLDRRVDVYALGVVLYELLTAHKPFEADSEFGLMRAILTQSPMPAVQFRPELPDSLRRILGRALAKDQAQRYPDCHAFQSDLEEFILSAGKPVTTQQVAQLLTQITSSTDQAPGPPPVTARGSGPNSSVTPVHTPPFPDERTDVVEASPEPGTVKMLRTEVVKARAPETQAESTTVPEVRPRLPATPPSPRVATRVQRTPVEPRRQGGWLVPLVGCVLFAAGGGVVMWRRVPPEPRPQAPRFVAAESAPRSEVSPSAGPSPAPSPAPSADSPAVQPQEHDAGMAAAVPQDTPDASVEVASLQPAEQEPAAAKPAPQEPDAARSGPSSPESAPAKPKRASKPVARKGILEINVWPSATVFLSERKLGDTPMPPLELQAGNYTLTLVNKSIAKTVVKSVEVKPGQTTVISINIFKE